MTVYTMDTAQPSGPRPPLKGDDGAARVGEELDPEVITLRDKIAIDVMHQIIDKTEMLWKSEYALASMSYRIADAMLAARRG